MKKRQFFIREKASNDLETIWDYTFDNWSLRQADKYYNDLIEAIEFLCENPTAGKSAEHLREGYLYFKVNSHLIFYIVSNTELDVIRILHAQMDIPNRFVD
jgi:toxin ParE1/3/4